MRLSYSFISNTNTQAGEDIKYAVTLSLRARKALGFYLPRSRTCLLPSKQLPPAL